MNFLTKPTGAAPAMQELAQAMAQRVMAASSHAEALKALRLAFPDAPLTLRVAALAMAAKPLAPERVRPHIPR
jgi:hypothetical protein